ncbi:MAG: ABC transporter permease subunit [Candidatus Micrarchaeaceae archaeon]
MDFGKANAIAIKDMKEVFSSISIYGPMIGVPLFFAIVLPVLTFYVAEYAAPGIASRFISAVNVHVANVGSFAFMSFFSVSILGPIFLTLPIITASVIAADSFAGEKERKTAEALLTTPLSNFELMLGKILASFIPTVLLTFAIFAIYGITTNYLSYSAFHTAILPTAPWLMMIALTPFLAMAAIGVVVLVSAHVKGVKEAQQISTLLILPLLVMPFMAIFGFAELTVSFIAGLIIAVGIIDAIVIYIGVKKFERENLV